MCGVCHGVEFRCSFLSYFQPKVDSALFYMTPGPRSVERSQFVVSIGRSHSTLNKMDVVFSFKSLKNSSGLNTLPSLSLKILFPWDNVCHF